MRIPVAKELPKSMPTEVGGSMELSGNLAGLLFILQEQYLENGVFRGWGIDGIFRGGASQRRSRRSSMRGMGCASFIVAALSCLNSTQNRRLPSFFLTMTTGEAQGLLEGRMTPFVNICWTWAISSHRTARLWRRYGWWRGGPSVSMAVAGAGCSLDRRLLG